MGDEQSTPQGNKPRHPLVRRTVSYRAPTHLKHPSNHSSQNGTADPLPGFNEGNSDMTRRHTSEVNQSPVQQAHQTPFQQANQMPFQQSNQQDQIHERFVKVFNEEKYRTIKGLYEDLNKQASLASQHQALAPVADLNKQSADGIVQVVEQLREEALKVESQITDPGQRHQIRLHFENQVDKLKPLLEKLIFTQKQQEEILLQQQQMIEKAQVQMQEKISSHNGNDAKRADYEQLNQDIAINVENPPISKSAIDGTADPMQQYMNISSQVGMATQIQSKGSVNDWGVERFS